MKTVLACNQVLRCDRQCCGSELHTAQWVWRSAFQQGYEPNASVREPDQVNESCNDEQRKGARW